MEEKIIISVLGWCGGEIICLTWGGRVRARQSFIPSSLKYFLILIQLLNSRSAIAFKFGTIQVFQSTSLGLDEV